MNKRLRKIALVTLPTALVVGALATLYLSNFLTQQSVKVRGADLDQDRRPSPGVIVSVDEPLPESMAEDELTALLDNPRVQRYLERESDKSTLVDYFSGNRGQYSDEEIWKLIEAIEREGRVMAYEGLALKLAWLERNTDSKLEFDTAAEKVLEKYRIKAARSAAEYDPYVDEPGFARYKEAEKRIVEEVQQMTSFPGGLSKQEYLRKRLLKAREEAYGS